MKSKLFSAVVLFIVTCMLSFGCAHNEIINYDHNMEGLQQQALSASDGKAFVRQGAKLNAKIGGKMIAVIDAPADVTWEEVKKLMKDQQRLFPIYDNIPFLKDAQVANSGGKGFSITYTGGLFFVNASIDVGFYVDERNRMMTGNKTGGSFLSFAVKNAEHDIGVIPIDDNKSFLVVRFVGSVMFPASVGAGTGASIIGVTKKIVPKMTSAYVDEIRSAVSRR